jgi:sulfate transport system ATP-binding protein
LIVSIQVENVSKRFGSFQALDNINLNLEPGKLVALLGPSGCGKTTLLRVIAGLEWPDQGRIIIDGRDSDFVHARERQVGFVFQHYALFRHMTVFENIAFGLRVMPSDKRPGEPDIRARVHELLNLVQLDWQADRYPAQLSGGQRQRIALARALAVRPKVLLLDEPFGALDAQVRKELRKWLRQLHDELHITSIFVTHDQDEALEVADQIVLVNQGKIDQVGPVQDVYDHPASAFGHKFLGGTNCFEGVISNRRLLFGNHSLQLEGAIPSDQQKAQAFARPYQLSLSQDVDGPASAIPVMLQRATLRGNMMRVDVTPIDMPGISYEVEIIRDHWATSGLTCGHQAYLRVGPVRAFGLD